MLTKLRIALLLLCALVVASAHADTIPALFLSDIHLDPLLDPAKAVQLAAAPAEQWERILASPDSPNRDASYAPVIANCGEGHDSSYAIWRSTLDAMHATTPHPRFVVLTGDLVVHDYHCRFEQELGKSGVTSQQFLVKLVQYLTLSLRTAYPDTPIYIALGNNDSPCDHNHFDAPTSGGLYAELAPVIASVVPPNEKAHVAEQFTQGGYFSLPLAGVPNTRLISLHDTVMEKGFRNCAEQKEPTQSAQQIAWFKAQIADARAHHERVWVIGHVPLGINPMATVAHVVKTAAKGDRSFCTHPEERSDITDYLDAPELTKTLADNADIVKLVVFGHTHADELHYLPSADGKSGIPIKVLSSVTPVSGGWPSFTPTQIDPSTAQMADYAVYTASNLTSIHASWSREYDFNEQYHQKGFTPQALKSITDTLVASPESDESKDYLRFYLRMEGARLEARMPGVNLLWPKFACTLGNADDVSYTRCACNSPR